MEELYPNLVPPQNIEAEEAVLGSILLASDSIISVMEFLTPEDFYRVSHQLIFAAMTDFTINIKFLRDNGWICRPSYCK